jgi:peptide/nickel transport system substrate-binding protein
MMHRRQFLAATGAGATALGLSRPAIAQAQGARVLKFVPQADLASVDPVWSTTLVTAMHSYLVWDHLYGLDEGLIPQPQMLAGAEVTDNGLTWTLTLRDGLVYHDGEKVRAIDAVASIERTAKRGPLTGTMMTAVNELSALDDNRLRFRLKKPFPLLPRALCDVRIMPERIARTDAFTQITEVIGSGPYRFVREGWRAGSSVVYARHEKYVPRSEPNSMYAGSLAANFDRVEWTIMPDPSTAAAALQRGEIDWLDQPLMDLVPQLRRSQGVKVEVLDVFGNIMSMFFNCHQPPFNNPKMRRAMLIAVNQQDFVDAVLGELGKELGVTGVGVFPPRSPYASNAGMESLPKNGDLAAARRLIAESGYKGEKVLFLSPSDFPSIRQQSLVAEALMKSLGINIEFASMDWGTMIARRNNNADLPDKGGWSAYNTWWTGLSISSPAVSLPLWANGADAKAWWRPQDAQMLQMRADWIDAPNLDAQKKIAADIQRRAMDEVVPFVPCGLFYLPTAFRSNLTGHPKSFFPAFWGVRRTA